MKRTHDNFYLNEKTSEIKDSFRAMADLISDNYSGTICDVGCATGVFPGYLKKRFPSADVVGIEYLESLRLKAEKDWKSVRFLPGDITDKASVTEKFDIITMSGVMCVIDDFEQVLKNILSWLKPKGRIILFNMISQYDIDVWVKYAPSSATYQEDELESGWNIISEKSLRLASEKNSAKLVAVHPFTIGVDLKPNSDNVMRSWTEKDANHERQIYNALHIRQPSKIAIIEKQ
jgi:SAM-dependent methyltransferase